ncbi:uncharacterized protein LOC107488973 [Arachis duranensis]|uniref:Uncharacterized protein LOC107488973 n=1 Tax=Arachis duranensis TaxID=130453 RepID=A0A6P4DFE9_ARADU|nr:uncharacterized protein LOC107488973 [Arachis duranensis]
MKRHLLTLLFFFLLLDSSFSISLGPVAKIILRNPAIKRLYKRQLPKKALHTGFDYLKNQSTPPPPPGAPEEKIQGLHLVKQYLNDYGYIQDSDNYTDLMDQDTVSAIKTYQTFFNLNVTGYLDDETLQQLSLFRCAVPDVNFNYSLSPTNNVSWPKGKNWFSNRTNLTYGFLPQSDIPENFTAVFKDSFKRWSDILSGFRDIAAVAVTMQEFKGWPKKNASVPLDIGDTSLCITAIITTTPLVISTPPPLSPKSQAAEDGLPQLTMIPTPRTSS